ncbi:GNAT family N-acetyltransferase [Streptomyces sp. NPDC056347]|uniref:GNAT family N-acetyltransferase n=1 Tax=Streptomyces sp. NPDC056347 TaxID=3345790 RepID=UPI0035DCC707
MAGEPDSATRWAPGYPSEGDALAARRFLDACARTGDPGPFCNYEIRCREDGRTIGGLGFHSPPDESGDVTIGYGLVPSARGRGYASEALRVLLEFARAHGVARVKGDAYLDNVASHRVMTAAGMRPAGQDEELRYFEITWTGPAVGAGPRS